MRPDQDSYFIQMALLVSTRATCSRAGHGCVPVNKRNHVLATGYNGPPAGQPHCIDFPCPGAGAPSGESLDLCRATHAEQNALLQCQNVWEIHAAYITASPCVFCLRLLMNTSCRRIVFLKEYPHSETKDLWLGGFGIIHGRTWEKYEPKDFHSSISILPGFCIKPAVIHENRNKR